MSSFTCPNCGSVSYNPNDAREGYCGRCHWWTGDPLLRGVKPNGRLTDSQNEGAPDRRFLGIDGTMGDAQDVDHPFLPSVIHGGCRICGLAASYRRHRS